MKKYIVELNTGVTAPPGCIRRLGRAKRLADKLDIHHTPKHGSWLNMAEIDRRFTTDDVRIKLKRRCPSI